jgi:hypothetical protein
MWARQRDFHVLAKSLWLATHLTGRLSFAARRCGEKDDVRLYGWALNLVNSPLLSVSMGDAGRIV